jgi:hypothetical protein
MGGSTANHRVIQATDCGVEIRDAGLPPGVALAQGRVLLSEDWHMDLPTHFWRRREQGSLVLWRPGLALWLDVADHDAASASEYLERRLAHVPKRATELRRARRELTAELSFRLRSVAAPCPALHALVSGPQSYVQAHAYFDREDEATSARALLETICVAPPFGLRWVSA